MADDDPADGKNPDAMQTRDRVLDVINTQNPRRVDAQRERHEGALC
jgi:hypothetical protein